MRYIELYRERAKNSGLMKTPNIEIVDNDLVPIMREKTPAERVQMIGAANRTARLLAAAGIRYQHPDWNEKQVHAEVIKRVCGGTA
jgi:hypothetical protein